VQTHAPALHRCSTSRWKWRVSGGHTLEGRRHV
jgi:hypothetical protein